MQKSASAADGVARSAESERQLALKKQKPMTSATGVPWAVLTQLRHAEQRMPNAIEQRTEPERDEWFVAEGSGGRGVEASKRDAIVPSTSTA